MDTKACVLFPGAFAFFDRYTEERYMLVDLYMAVSDTHSWDFMAGWTPHNTTVRSAHTVYSPNIKPDHICLANIHRAMNYKHHTPASYRWAMWHIQYIAKHGWKAYSSLMIANPQRYLKYGIRSRNFLYKSKASNTV